MTERFKFGRTIRRRPRPRLAIFVALNAVVLSGALALPYSLAQAQVGPAPNPGAIQNDIERQLRQFEQQRPPKQQGPAVVGPQREKPEKGQPGGPKFKLRKVRFDKSKFLSREELNAIAAKYIGKEVDIAALQQLVADVNALYAQKGIVTGIATLPEQNPENGVVHIKLTEGRLEKTKVEGNVQTSSQYILYRVDQPKGQILDVPKLNQDVVWFNRTNDVQIRALLAPGSSFGLTDLQFAVTEPPRNVLQLFYDNQGVQSTGEVEQGIFYKGHSILGQDDRLTIYGVHSDGNLNGNVAYNIPIDDWGGRIGASYTQGQIRIVDGPFLPLDDTGTSRVASINFSQPVFATENWLALFNMSTNYGTTLNDFAAVAITNDYFYRGTAGASVTYSNSQLSLSLSPAFNQISWHDYILGGNRSFETFTGTALAQAKLPKQFSLTVLGSAQGTREPLLPGDQLFFIGGPTTVRGYPTQAVAGDSGFYDNVELHRDWSKLVRGLDTYIFSDSGAVFSTAPAEINLVSVGAGASWSPFAWVTLEASLGVPLVAVVPGEPRYQAYGRIILKPLLLVNQQGLLQLQ